VKNLEVDKITKKKHKTSPPPNKEEKIVTCYICHKKFDINLDDASRYRYGKYPMCDYCAEFYGFYFNDPDKKKIEKI
jgi:hypothetical protein